MESECIRSPGKQCRAAGMGAILRIAAVAATAAAVAAFAAAPTLELKPGEYAVTITYQVQEQRQDAPLTAIRCITAADLGDPEKIFNLRAVTSERKEDTCSMKNLKSVNGQISYDAECSNRTVHVEGKVSDVAFSVVRTVTPKANRKVSLRSTVKGTRTADCVATGNP